MIRKISRGTPYSLGVRIIGDEDGYSKISFAFISRESDCGVVLYDKKSGMELQKIPFPQEYDVGNIHCMTVEGIDDRKIAYCFYEGERLVADENAKAFLPSEKYGVLPKSTPRLALFYRGDFNWEGDQPLTLPYEDCVGYCLHVRGFTRHRSSGVKGKGTFAGVTEKIPYLKDLGITTLEFQPIYEFNEASPRLNYWGYTKGRYYSPKSSYAMSGDAVTECKEMIKALHKNGIEAVLQFYFTPETSVIEIQGILHYWVMEYHVDGFHLKGENILPDVLAGDPALAKTKLWYYRFPQAEAKEAVPDKKVLAEYQDACRYELRRFLKGDEGMLPSVLGHILKNPMHAGKINYLTNYDGFTLADMVSYERKHNEDNGEDNRDGNDYNASWNCGIEGPSRKRTIMELRHKQQKNALLLLLLSQGMPLFFMGDEFGNSQKGNNNPYCQDNDITWLNWRGLDTERELFSFTKNLIALRREHPVFRQKNALRMMDYASLGYPDVSYHGRSPWKPDTAVYSRQIGLMYCGRYVRNAKNEPDDFFYVAYNLHWEKFEFSLPNLPKDMQWKILMVSGDAILEEEEADERAVVKSKGQGTPSRFQRVCLSERCICVLQSETLHTASKRKKTFST